MVRNRSFVVVVAVSGLLGSLGCFLGCGPPPPLTGFDVTLVPTSECTLTGQASRDCEDEALLAQRSVSGRWIFDRSGDGTALSITTHEGSTLPGLIFNNDLTVIDAEGCRGEGGLCAFTRRRFSSVDANNQNCARFGELVAMGHFDPDDEDHFIGFFSDVNGNDEACGTPTVNELVFSIDGVRVDDPVLARTASAEQTLQERP